MSGNFTIKSNSNSIHDLWEVITDESSVKKQPVVYHFAEDPLAYLVHWYQSRDQMNLAQLTYGSSYGHMLKNLEQVAEKFPLLVSLNQYHRDTAEAIRDYYKSKLVRLGLVGERLTDFRQRLYEVVNKTDSIAEDELGILCKLPEFYAEDTFMDQLLSDSVSLPNKLINSPIDATFKYVGFVDKRRRYKKHRFYWFRSPSGYLATFFVDLNGNAALPVLDQYLTQDSQYHIRCQLVHRTFPVGNDLDFSAYFLNHHYDIEKTKP